MLLAGFRSAPKTISSTKKNAEARRGVVLGVRCVKQNLRVGVDLHTPLKD